MQAEMQAEMQTELQAEMQVERQALDTVQESHRTGNNSEVLEASGELAEISACSYTKELGCENRSEEVGKSLVSTGKGRFASSLLLH